MRAEHGEGNRVLGGKLRDRVWSGSGGGDGAVAARAATFEFAFSLHRPELAFREGAGLETGGTRATDANTQAQQSVAAHEEAIDSPRRVFF